MAVIDDDVVRSAAAIAANECFLLVLKKHAFRQLLHTDRNIAFTVLWNVLRQVSARLRATNEKVMMFLYAPGSY
jgi:CRP-like cAMP-binding protein